MKKHFFEIKEGDVFYDNQRNLIVAVEDARSPSDCIFVADFNAFKRYLANSESGDIYDVAYYENFAGIGEFVYVKQNLGKCQY